MFVDHYQVLGLEPNASPEAIRTRYQELIAETLDEQEFWRVDLAYQVLSNQIERQKYDRKREEQLAGPRRGQMEILGLDAESDLPNAVRFAAPPKTHTVPKPQSYTPRRAADVKPQPVSNSEPRYGRNDAYWWQDWTSVTLYGLTMALIYLGYHLLGGNTREYGPAFLQAFTHFVVASVLAFGFAKTAIHYYRYRYINYGWAFPTAVLLATFCILLARRSGFSGLQELMVTALALLAPLFVFMAFSFSALLPFTRLGRWVFFFLCLFPSITVILFLNATIPNTDLANWSAAWMIIMLLMIL